MMNTREGVNNMLESCEQESLFADGFDSAIIGLSQDGHLGSFRVCIA